MGQATSRSASDVAISDKFLEWEYATLRKEIGTSQDNVFKIMIASATAIPAIQQLVTNANAGYVAIGLPFVVVALVMLFINHRNSISRCGFFIQTEIEPTMKGVPQWETWLKENKHSDHRSVDNALTLSFYILSAVYYVFSSVLAVQSVAALILGVLKLEAIYPATVPIYIVAWIFYIVVGLVTGYLLVTGMGQYAAESSAEKDRENRLRAFVSKLRTTLRPALQLNTPKTRRVALATLVVLVLTVLGTQITQITQVALAGG